MKYWGIWAGSSQVTILMRFEGLLRFLEVI